jgi:hypothetical protein
VIAWQIEHAKKEGRRTKQRMADLMESSCMRADWIGGGRMVL